MTTASQRDQIGQRSRKVILAAVNDLFFYAKIRDALLPQGYHLERTRTQQEILEKATALRPVVVILNMNDPAIDGLNALKQLKTEPRLKMIPVLAFASHKEVDTWKLVKESGIAKVVSRNEFSARTKELVEEAQRSIHETSVAT